MSTVPLPFNYAVNACVQPCSLEIERGEHAHIALGSAHKNSCPGRVIRIVIAAIVQRIIEVNNIISILVARLNFGNIILIGLQHLIKAAVIGTVRAAC